MVKNPHGSAYRRFCHFLLCHFLSILHLGGEKRFRRFTTRFRCGASAHKRVTAVKDCVSSGEACRLTATASSCGGIVIQKFRRRPFSAVNKSAPSIG